MNNDKEPIKPDSNILVWNFHYDSMAEFLDSDNKSLIKKVSKEIE